MEEKLGKWTTKDDIKQLKINIKSLEFHITNANDSHLTQEFEIRLAQDKKTLKLLTTNNLELESR